MKRLVLLMLLITASCVGWAENVAFLKTGGTGDGLSPVNPTGSINTAYKILEDAGGGGTIVLVDKFTLSANFMRAVTNTLVVKLTSKYNGIDYRQGNPNCALTVGTTGFRYVLNGPHTFENITFKGNTALTTTNYILFIANYNAITMGEGINVTDFPSTVISSSCSIVGGSQQGQSGTPASLNLDTHITVNSGKFIVVGFNRQITSTYTGTAHVNITGGEITTLYGGSINGGVGGNFDLNISGGIYTGTIYAGNRDNVNAASGKTTMVVSGGDFNSCPAIVGLMDGGATIDLSAYNNIGFMKRRLYYFDNLITKDGIVPFLTPNKVFNYGSFTDATGLTIPYRIRIPDNYDLTKKYPILFDLHDNGSRGNDNTLQVTSTGSAFLSTVLNSGHECIILAPQCADTTSWVQVYPGNAGYTVGGIPMSRYLKAAKELFDTIIQNYSVDLNRLYIFGSSNGGGATWDLMCRFPRLFAAGIPMAGCGESSNASAISDSLINIPIWTFHGDADLTLPVSGTRGIVNAIKASGGTKINYTEFPGVDHGVWWVASSTEGLVDWLFDQEKTSDIETSVSSKFSNFVNIENPAKNLLRIKLSGSAMIELFTLTGQSISKIELPSGENVLPIYLKQGIYLIRIKFSNQVFSRKIMIE